MKAWSGSGKNGYLGFGCPLWSCEENQGCQVMLFQVRVEAEKLYHSAAGGAVSYLVDLDDCASG